MEDQGVKKLALNGLITQRSKVQILPPQPTIILERIHHLETSTISGSQLVHAHENLAENMGIV